MTGPADGERAQGDADLVALGPYFALARHQPDQAPAAPWRSLREIVDDPEVLRARVAAVRAFLAAGSGRAPEAVELRVAASVTHLGLIARLASPLLAMAVLRNHVPELTIGELHWQPELGGAFPLSLPDTGTSERLPHVDGTAAAFAAVAVDGVGGQLAGAMSAFGVNRHVLRGNLASALAGATRTLASIRPRHGVAAEAFLDVLTNHPALAGSSRRLDDGTFRRTNCCLIYRAAPDHDGPLCGDCGLKDAPAAQDAPVTAGPAD